MRHGESRLQIQCVKWFDMEHGKRFNREVIKKTKGANGLYTLKAQKVSLLFAVPNGGSRGKTEAGIMVAEGVRTGVADLVLSFPNCGYSGLYIEMKTATGKQSQSQKVFSELSMSVGYKYAVVRSVDEFIITVNNYINK